MNTSPMKHLALIMAVLLTATTESSSEAKLQNGMIAGSAHGKRQIVSWFAEGDALAVPAREASERITVYLDRQGISSQNLEYVVIVAHTQSIINMKINPKAAPFANERQIAAMNGLIEIDGGCGHFATTLNSNQNIIFAFSFTDAKSDKGTITRSTIEQCAVKALKMAGQKY